MERTIVVCDDSSEFLAMVELALEPIAAVNHLRILHASSGEEALALLQSHPEAAILLTDLAMPTMNGLELIAQCRRLYPMLQSVVLSGAADAHSIIEAIRAGATDYIVKPPTLEELETALSNALARHAELEQAFRTRERLRGYERELAIAAEIQRHMLPPSHVHDPEDRYDLSALLVPARHVAGDFYDHWVTSDGRLVMAVGDVSGKGVSAALWMAVTKTLLRSHLEHDPSPVRAMEATNRALATNNPQAFFVTVLVAVFDPDTGDLCIVSAGHPPPYCISEGGTIRQLELQRGMPLGAIESNTFASSVYRLHSGDRLVLFTDGALDAASDDLALQQEQWADIVGRAVACGGDLTASLIAALSVRWVSDTFPDDVTFVVLDYKSPTRHKEDSSAIGTLSASSSCGLTFR
ncbi:MAG: SpoIIE family protein phosphatase [Chlorobi bacterium]|nr:SpoIIE family protein phosphatase [Chlorobiota bacterium]